MCFIWLGDDFVVFGQHGGDVNAVDHTGQTALHWSSVRGHIQVAELLLKEGAKVDAADLYGYQVCILTSSVSLALVLPLCLLLGVKCSFTTDRQLIVGYLPAKSINYSHLVCLQVT